MQNIFQGQPAKGRSSRSLCPDADLYILDEPISGLDPLMERVFQECILDIKKEGKSICLFLSEVERLCDKVSIIRLGQIIETVTLSELRHLTRTRVMVETKQGIPSLGIVKGVYDVQEIDVALSFQVDSEEIGNVFKFLSQYDIAKLESAPPTLEDLFMRHYEGVGGAS